MNFMKFKNFFFSFIKKKSIENIFFKSNSVSSKKKNLLVEEQLNLSH